jgi:hypothetical protein
MTGSVYREATGNEWLAIKAQQYMQREVGKLERERRQRAGNTRNWESYQFAAFPTCPPSTSITFRGGLTWWGARDFEGYGFYMPGYVVDLSDSDIVSVRPNRSRYTTNYTIPYGYVSYIICANHYGMDAKEEWPETVPSHSFRLISSTSVSPYYVEVETAAEAEASLLEINLQRVTYYGISLGGVILRNNGDTSNPNQYMPIDRVNRGRSYLWWAAKSTYALA